MRRCRNAAEREGTIHLKAVFILVILVHTAGCSEPVDKHSAVFPRIAHAGGGYQGATYTNSLNALASNADRFALFEIDFSFTSDDRLVCMHDWGVSAQKAFGMEFAAPPTYERFVALAARAADFQPCTLDTLVQWLRDHPGPRIVTDLKDENLVALARIARRFPDMLHRFIPQIYHPDEYAPVRLLGYRDVIFTIYRFRGRDELVVAAASGLPFFAVTLPLARADTLVPKLRDIGVGSYVHTVNDPQELAFFNDTATTEIYTDWLYE